jgi:hypothetical protein
MLPPGPLEMILEEKKAEGEYVGLYPGTVRKPLAEAVGPPLASLTI